MRKKEFLQELRMRLKGIDNLEQENILNYYDEMISDKMDEGFDEERFIRSLGSFDEIMRKLNIQQDEKERNKIKYDSIIDESTKSDNNSDNESRKNNRNYNKSYKETSNNKKTLSELSPLIIILIIVAFPFWFSVLMTAIGIAISAVAIIVSFMVAGIAIAISGICCIIFAFTLFSTTTIGAFSAIGAGLIILGIGCILTPITLKIGFYVLKQSIVAIKKLVSLIEKKVKERN